jgi:hypothetical protein
MQTGRHPFQFRPSLRHCVGALTLAALLVLAGCDALGLGLLNGLLPCGLVYSLLAMAAVTGTMLGGALTMLVFGGATVPALFALAWIGDLLQPSWQHRLHRASGALVIVLGLITVLRGTPAMHLLMS